MPGVKELTKEQLRAGEAIALVDSKFKGYAETAAKTGLGPLKILQNQLGDMMEDIGRIAIPFVTSLAEKFKSLAEIFEGLSPITKEWAVRIGGLIAFTGPMLVLAGNVLKLANAFKILGINIDSSVKSAMKLGVISAVSKGISLGKDALVGDRAAYESDFAERARQAYASGDQAEIMKTQMAGIATAALDLLGGLNFGAASRVLAIGRGEGLQGKQIEAEHSLGPEYKKRTK